MKAYQSLPPSNAKPLAAKTADLETANSGTTDDINKTAINRTSCPCGGSCPTCQVATNFGKEQSNLIQGAQSPIIRRRPAGDAPEQVPSSVDTAVRQPGIPLPPDLLQRNEDFFGVGLGHVRLHDDSLAATAAAESRAHALTSGSHILLSRNARDFSKTESQKTLAHEIAHTLQPASSGSSASTFDSDDSSAEISASKAADSFGINSSMSNNDTALPARSGVMRELDPRLDDLEDVIDDLPSVLTQQGMAEALERAAPGLDLADPDNYEPLRVLLDSDMGDGAGESILSEWRQMQTNQLSGSPVAVSTPPARQDDSPVRVTSAPAETRLSAESNFTDSVVSVIPPASMSGTALEAEIEELRMLLGMPSLDPDAPKSDMTEIYDSDGQLRFDRLQALEAEYFDRRRLLETMRTATTSIEHRQREPGPDASDVVGLASVMMNPTVAAPALATEVASALLGHPVEDFATGFLPGFLGGAVLELPRDAFEKLDAETREHPILFNGGVLAGIPVGAGKGLVDMIVGLAELLGLAVRFSPMGMAWQGMKDAYNAITDPDGYQAEQMRKLEQARAVGEAIVSLIGSLISDPAFMISHGRELGEIAGRSAGQWFNEDYMQRSTFDKGYTVGYVEGRILFEIFALFFGPEVWIARGSAAVGEVARLSRPLRTAILEAIERIPALRRLLTLGREGATAAREAGTAERVLAEGGEVISDASRASEGAADLGRGSGATDDSARALESAADDGSGVSSRADDAAESAKPEPERPATVEPKPLDPADLAEVGPVNDETLVFFREHPERLEAWAHNAEATRVCKLCHSPCFPKNVTPAQTRRLERLIQRAETNGMTIEDHVLHDPLSAMNETQINNFIEGFERRLDDPMVDFGDREMLLGLLGEADPAALSTAEKITGAPSASGFSGDLGEGMEAAGAGARSLPQTYAQRFSAATRDQLRRIFTESGEGALRSFADQLGLTSSGLRQVEIPTSAGVRRVDRMFTEGTEIVLREVKNYPNSTLSNTERIGQELFKDVEILNRYPYARVDWHITGNIDNAFLLELETLEIEMAGRFRIIRGASFNIIP